MATTPAKKATSPAKKTVAKAAPSKADGGPDSRASEEGPSDQGGTRQGHGHRGQGACPCAGEEGGAGQEGRQRASQGAGPGKAAAKGSGGFDAAFLESQRTLLMEERANLLGQAQRLEDEAAELMEDLDPGDVQFDDESGEGDSLVVERERDLALSAQARQTISDIDAALGPHQGRHVRALGHLRPPHPEGAPEGDPVGHRAGRGEGRRARHAPVSQGGRRARSPR